MPRSRSTKFTKLKKEAWRIDSHVEKLKNHNQTRQQSEGPKPRRCAPWTYEEMYALRDVYARSGRHPHHQTARADQRSWQDMIAEINRGRQTGRFQGNREYTEKTCQNAISTNPAFFQDKSAITKDMTSGPQRFFAPNGELRLPDIGYRGDRGRVVSGFSLSDRLGSITGSTEARDGIWVVNKKAPLPQDTSGMTSGPPNDPRGIKEAWEKHTFKR